MQRTPSQTAQRSDRATEVRRERRRKPGSTAHTGLKLHVDSALLDPAYEYRWANDENGRVQQLEAQDWDVVDSEAIAKEGNVGGGSVPTRHVGGNGRAVLMRKLKDWHEEDRKARFKALDEMDKAIRKGAEQKDSELAGAYTPNGENTISR